MAWLCAHNVRQERLVLLAVDLSVDGLNLAPPVIAELGQNAVTDVINVAGAYAFGMSASEARAANVDTSRRIVEFAARLLRLRRLVHVSGYRVGGQDPSSVPWSEEKRRREYSRFGAYEASKVESDAVVQARALDLGVALTVVNPASVIGDSETGESPQVLGLGATVHDLWNGKLAAIPGDGSTFLPVVTVDYLAAFIALVPIAEETLGQSYWVLDDATPPLGGLLTLLGDHLGVRVPGLRIPVGLVRRLPSWLTRADPETLSFLSSDRYPTGPALELARGHGLDFPDVRVALTRWADHLVAVKQGSGISVPGDQSRVDPTIH